MNRLEFPELFSDRVVHGFFGRQGGVSCGIFQSLNIHPDCGDDPQFVAENHARVLAALGGIGDLVTLRQIHSGICHIVDLRGGECEGDGLATDQAGVAISVLTADCAPILFEGRKADGAPVIGAAHAGWGGALKGICEATIEKMVKLGALPETIVAAIGPCIAVASYQVGPDFEKPFLAEHPEAFRFFRAYPDGAHFDLSSYVVWRLERAGARRIVMAARDTYINEDDYFSYRRATHRAEDQYGRQVSAIAIRQE